MGMFDNRTRERERKSIDERLGRGEGRGEKGESEISNKRGGWYSYGIVMMRERNLQIE